MTASRHCARCPSERRTQSRHRTDAGVATASMGQRSGDQHSAHAAGRYQHKGLPCTYNVNTGGVTVNRKALHLVFTPVCSPLLALCKDLLCIALPLFLHLHQLP